MTRIEIPINAHETSVPVAVKTIDGRTTVAIECKGIILSLHSYDPSFLSLVLGNMKEAVERAKK